jgi:CheY-like chemotaxis protein
MIEHRVLLVDDDAAMRAIVTSVAHHLGLACVATADEEDAVDQLATRGFCVALVGSSAVGSAVLRRVMEYGPRIPIVALASSPDDVRPMKLDPQVVTAIITKPVNLELLRLTIEAACLRRNVPVAADH